MAVRRMTEKEFEIAKLVSLMTSSTKDASYVIAYEVLREGKSIESVAKLKNCTPQNVSYIVKRFRGYLDIYNAAKSLDKKYASKKRLSSKVVQ